MMIFEDPTWLYVILAMVWIVLAGLWWSRRSKMLAVSLCIPVLAVGALILVDHLVVTDREEIVQALGDLSGHLDNRRYDALADCLADDFSTPGLENNTGKFAVENLCKVTCERFKVTRFIIKSVDVDISSDGIAATVTVGTLVFTDGGSSRIPIRWIMQMVKKDDRWLIQKISDCNTHIEGISG